MKKSITLILILLLVIFYSCGRFGNKSADKSKQQQRIVCISKQLTEIIFALGAGNKIVGVDLSSTYPPEVSKLPTVGYHRALGIEGIVSLNPTAVYDNGGIGPESIIEQLKKIGIPLVQYQHTPTIESTKELFRVLGKDFSAEVKAEELCNKLDADMKKVEEKAKEYQNKPRVLLIHFGRAMNNYFVVGNKGNANDMIMWAGGQNVADTSGFKMLSAEYVVKAQPEVILVTDFGYDRAGGSDGFKQLPGIGLTPAAKNNKIYRTEEHDLIYFGPRTGDNILKLMEMIHK